MSPKDRIIARKVIIDGISYKVIGCIKTVNGFEYELSFDGVHCIKYCPAAPFDRYVNDWIESGELIKYLY
jgi:hypothetical protein